jgi:hypothetical protein
MDTSESKPRLASGDSVETKILSKPRRAASARLIASVTPVKGEGFGKNIWKLTKAIFAFAIVVAFTLLFSWVILVSTVAATPNVNGKALFVDRNAWGLGAAPDKTLAYVTEFSDYGLINKFIYHVSGDISEGSVVVILARPLDTIATNIDGKLFINDVATSYTSDSIIERKQLGNSYVISCLEGSCGKPGGITEIPMEQAIGEVSGVITASGIKPYGK